jgi:hypothetical protein
MKLQHLLLLGAVLGGAAACSEDSGAKTTDPGPLAYVRYVHAMPDTAAVDVHLVDQVENLNATAVAYRTVTAYQGIAPGARHFRVWTTSNDINVIGANKILDTTITVAANTYYTIVHSGFARTGQTPHQQFCVLTDAAPTPAAGKFAIRAIVAAPSFAANQDVYLTRNVATSGTAAPAPGAGATPVVTATNVTAAAACPAPTAWVELDTVQRRDRVTNIGGNASIYVYNAGTVVPAAPNLTSVVVAGEPTGKPPESVVSAIAGARIPGSVLAAFLFPPGVVGSPAAGAATAQYGVDKRPPETP